MAARKRSRCWTLLLWFLLLVWLPGLLWFYQQIPTEVDFPDPQVPTDAIVVLTGGMGRVEQGIRLLEEGRSNNLLISGVDKDVKPREMVAEYGIDTHHPMLADGKTRIILDYGPRDTVGNARETARWMKKQGIQSIRLVTSSYHMPRSVMEFRHVMPDALILPSPVFPEWSALDKVVLVSRGSLRLILLEYHKYMLRRLYYALPTSLQIFTTRSSDQRPITDIKLAKPPAETPAEKEPAE